MTTDRASVYVRRENREWKYQEMSVVGGLACRFSEVQSSSQEQPSWGNYNREKRVFKKFFLMGISGLFPSYRWLKKSWKDFVLLFSFSSFLPSFFFFFLSFFIHSVFFLPAPFSLSLLSFFFLFTDHLACEVCEIYNSVSSSDCYYSGQYHIMHYAISY